MAARLRWEKIGPCRSDSCPYSISRTSKPSLCIFLFVLRSEDGKRGLSPMPRNPAGCTLFPARRVVGLNFTVNSALSFQANFVRRYLIWICCVGISLGAYCSVASPPLFNRGFQLRPLFPFTGKKVYRLPKRSNSD